MTGTWYVTNGFNSDYDCFACQKLTFDFERPTDSLPVFYNALYNLIAVNGTLIWNDIQMQGSEDTPGVLKLTGRDSGFEIVQHWYVLHQETDTMLVYYCGDLMTWHFEGVLVMSKTPSLNSERIPQLTNSLAAVGLSFSDLCSLSPSADCKDAPNPFQPYESQSKDLN